MTRVLSVGYLLIFYMTGRTLPTLKKGDVPLPGQMIGAASFRNSKCWWIKRFWETILFQTNPNVLGCDAQVRQGNPRHQILRNHPFWHWRIWWIPLQFFHHLYVSTIKYEWLLGWFMVGTSLWKFIILIYLSLKCFSTINLPSTHTWRGIVFIPVSLGPARPGPVGSPHNTRRCTDKEPPVEQGMKQEVPEVKNWRQLLGRCKYMCIYIDIDTLTHRDSNTLWVRVCSVADPEVNTKPASFQVCGERPEDLRLR